MGSLINWILILTGPLLRCGMSRGDARDIRANERGKKYETKAFNLHTGKNMRKIVEMVFDLSI